MGSRRRFTREYKQEAVQLVTQRDVSVAQRGRRVYYGTLADLITSLEEAAQAGHLSHRLKTLGFPSLLVVDEIGYLPITGTGAMLSFQLMSRRFEHTSTVLTSNKGFEEWGESFGDDVTAAALIDRLVHHCHIVNIRGNSYRMRNHADLQNAMQGALHPEFHSESPPESSRRPAEAIPSRLKIAQGAPTLDRIMG
jgi:IstB-like ATP binding protein